MPLISDDLSHWSDIFHWRQHHYQAIVNAYEALTPTSADPQVTCLNVCCWKDLIALSNQKMITVCGVMIVLFSALLLSFYVFASYNVVAGGIMFSECVHPSVHSSVRAWTGTDGDIDKQ